MVPLPNGLLRGYHGIMVASVWTGQGGTCPPKARARATTRDDLSALPPVIGNAHHAFDLGDKGFESEYKGDGQLSMVRVPEALYRSNDWG